jgi:pyridoxal phosphate enzyme (YggS family)
VAELITGLDAGKVRERVAEARERIAQAAERAGREPADVELLAAVKYVALDELGTLADAGLTLLGENRAQELVAKAEAYPGAFTWDFIGHLQSRKVKDVAPHVRYIHSVSSDSALAQLAKHAPRREDFAVLVEVNVAGEASKSGIEPAELAAFVERCPVPAVGLMTMPPAVTTPEQNRPHFAALRELAAAHGLRQLSMGTSQDYEVAVEEGATIVRLGSTLYR